jgi:1-acyl-sn-glycerol-3-phosphate acyltransferase
MRGRLTTTLDGRIIIVLSRLLDKFVAGCIIAFAQALTGVRAYWTGVAPELKQRIYFGNHSSHGDFVLIWASLPGPIRARTRPVAGSDYWMTTSLKRYIATRALNAVLIDRDKGSGGDQDPIAIMASAIDAGASLIVFPEGTRNITDAKLLSFKSGIYRLAQARPNLEFVPCWIENLNRVLPKGEVLPVPLLCTTTFGPPIQLEPNEEKDRFLERTRNALLALAPTEQR